MFVVGELLLWSSYGRETAGMAAGQSGEASRGATGAPFPWVLLSPASSTTGRALMLDAEGSSALSSTGMAGEVAGAGMSPPSPPTPWGGARVAKGAGGDASRLAGNSGGGTPKPQPRLAGSNPAHPITPLSYAELYGLALAVSGSQAWAREAAAVSWCESAVDQSLGADPAVYGDGGAAFGLLQVHGAIHGDVPAEPAAQLRQGYAIYLETGDWRRWSCAGVLRG